MRKYFSRPFPPKVQPVFFAQMLIGGDKAIVFKSLPIKEVFVFQKNDLGCESNFVQQCLIKTIRFYSVLFLQ